MTTNQLYEQLKSKPFILAGPCVIENEAMVMDLAEKISQITKQLNIHYIFDLKSN